MARLTYETPKIPSGPSDIAAQAWNDPWFALGNLLARAWNRQYNERGINNLINSVEGSIPSESQPVPPENTPLEQTSANRIMSNYEAENPTPQVGSAPAPMYTIDQNFPGMTESGNIDLNNRPVVKNPDGTISTVRSVGVNLDGKEYLLPTVSDDGRILSTDEAVDQFRKTGQHLGVFDSPDSSTKYAQALHEQQGSAYGNPNTLMQAVNAYKSGNMDLGQLSRAINGGAVTANPSVQGALASGDQSAVLNALGNSVANSANATIQDNLYRGLGNIQPTQMQETVPTPFNAKDWAAKVQAAGIAQGRPQEQIDEAIKRLTPQALEAEDRWKKYKSDMLLGMADIALRNGNYGAYNNIALSLAEDNPELGDKMLSGAVSPKDFFNNENDIKKTLLNAVINRNQAAQSHQYNLENIRESRKPIYNTSGLGLTGRGRSRATSSTGSSASSGSSFSAPTAENKTLQNVAGFAFQALSGNDLTSLQNMKSQISDIREKNREDYKFGPDADSYLDNISLAIDAKIAALNGDNSTYDSATSRLSNTDYGRSLLRFVAPDNYIPSYAPDIGKEAMQEEQDRQNFTFTPTLSYPFR